jgi:Asp-tRNA(Asn)/Glu-tRNA(Gln) amidotransferase A subunit family amidase
MLVAKAVADHKQELSPALREFLAIATSPPAVTADELLQTLIGRDMVRQRFLAEMQGYDALLLPVCAEPAFKHGEAGWDDSFSTNYLRDMRFSQWFNLLCLPAISVPLGRSQDGLPIGVQIVAHPFQEPLLFAVAELIEKEGAWTHAALA